MKDTATKLQRLQYAAIDAINEIVLGGTDDEAWRVLRRVYEHLEERMAQCQGGHVRDADDLL